MDKLTLLKPDDWHCHLRDGAFLTRTVQDSAKQFARAIVMPNLKPPITHLKEALAYRERIMASLLPTQTFTPLMTLYLTDQTTPSIIQEAKKSGVVFACKLYPAGVTTHSQAGVTKIENLYPVFASMEEVGLPLLIHGEVNDQNVDIFDREKLFIDRYLTKLIRDFFLIQT